MKIKYLGTAAAEGIPALFCDCEVCKKAAKRGGKEIKSRHQALLDDNILLDFGPDTINHIQKYGIRSDLITDILITHSHTDHFYPADMEFLGKGYATRNNKDKIHFYGNKIIVEKAKYWQDLLKVPERFDAKEVKAFKTFKFRGYEVTPLPANHDPKSIPLIYLIEKNGKSMIYGHDTSIFADEVFNYLDKNLKKPLSFISLDITQAIDKNNRYYHMSMDVFLETIDLMKKKGILDDKTIVVASHISHNGKINHKELAKMFKKYGVILSYDGMEISF